MSTTQQAFQQFKECMQTFLYNFKVMEQSFEMLQMAANELEDQLTPQSHPVTRQPAIHRTDQLHEQPKVGRPVKYTSEEERREAQRRSAKKSYEKRKAKLQALEEEVQRLKNELDQEPK